MELRTRAGTALHPVEVDLLCTFAEVQPPFPLDIPSVGLDEVERGVLFHEAAVQLVERGLADERGPLDVAEEFVYLLRSCSGVLDMVINRDSGSLAVAVLAARDDALLVVQDSADPFEMIRMRAVTLDEAIGAVSRLVPKVPSPMTAPFSLPKRALEQAFEAMMSRMPDPDTGGEPRPMRQDEVEELLASHGIDDRVSRRMVSHLQPVLGNGQAGVAKRDDTEEQWRRAGEEIRWLDTERGRYRLAVVDGEDAAWMSVNPLGPDELLGELRGLAARARG